ASVCRWAVACPRLSSGLSLARLPVCLFVLVCPPFCLVLPFCSAQTAWSGLPLFRSLFGISKFGVLSCSGSKVTRPSSFFSPKCNDFIIVRWARVYGEITCARTHASSEAEPARLLLKLASESEVTLSGGSFVKWCNRFSL
uniref:Secreted protein n=2 Tax=Macrostomum lignano TaxID=282301 RepID=A0A1I8G9G5_9PLAT